MCTRYALSEFAEWMGYLSAQKIVNNINSMFPFFPSCLPATVHLSAKEETVLLLPTAPQRELAVFAVLDRLEVWPACWLDRTDRMCGLRAGQERGRNGQAAVLLHHAAAGADRAVSVRVSACPTRCDLEEFPPLVPGTNGDTGWAAAVLRWWVDYFCIMGLFGRLNIYDRNHRWYLVFGECPAIEGIRRWIFNDNLES